MSQRVNSPTAVLREKNGNISTVKVSKLNTIIGTTIEAKITFFLCEGRNMIVTKPFAGHFKQKPKSNFLAIGKENNEIRLKKSIN